MGISFHCGSGCYDPTAFVVALNLAREAFDTAHSLGLSLSLVDMGGGFPGLDGGECVTDDEDDNAASGDDAPTESNTRKKGMKLRRLFCDDLTMLEVSQAVTPVLDALFPTNSGVQIIAEPGRYQYTLPFNKIIIYCDRYFVEGSCELYLNIFDSCLLSHEKIIQNPNDGTSNSDFSFVTIINLYIFRYRFIE